MAEYTYKDVIIDPEDLRVEIGKEYYFGITPKEAMGYAKANGRGAILNSVDAPSEDPFFLDAFNEGYPCIIRKKEYTKNDIITDVSDPRLKDAIGKTVYVAHKLYGSIVDNANNNDSANKGVLVNLGYDPSHPFEVHTESGLHWDKIIISKNQPPRKKYVPFDLSDTEVRKSLRERWIESTRGEYQISGFHSFDGEDGEEWMVSITTGYVTPENLCALWKFDDGTPCGRLVEE